MARKIYHSLLVIGRRSNKEAFPKSRLPSYIQEARTDSTLASNARRSLKRGSERDKLTSLIVRPPSPKDYPF